MQNLSPDFVKLDHTKSRNLSNSPIKQVLISLILEFTHEKMQLVLEGIESKVDLSTAK
ncbi:EAL domain-containing protein (putative c-di-GMP-specific phosphodiesterase class I) [Oikeobacillus pervagus]|uniref:EAL domain-containing protein (Putative c-di-GMP-specific phosphodiesterase class I) n=2 Tax=Oikeobacillus pervagus TaxID=1325931 RepID=A0AAJ1T3C8_9BACI|nr:EAL domain-containing protein (putative c-di-GMP-specific phosphodiesterase class I) [Oikeobacillus pervagus]